MSIWHSELIIEQRTAGRKAQEGKASMVGKKERTAKTKLYLKDPVYLKKLSTFLHLNQVFIYPVLFFFYATWSMAVT